MEIQSFNSCAVLTFSEGAGYPRLSADLLDELESLLTSIQREGLFRGVVIAANSVSFAIGADVEEIERLQGAEARVFARKGQSLLGRIARCPLPVVAGIRGYCLGGALDLALACHARVATYDSSFGHPGGALGLLTGWGGTQRLPRLIGMGQALQLLLTGERVSAAQALTLGLVDELVASQDLVAAAVRRAENPAP